MSCLFCRIIHQEIPATILHETEHVLAFRDIAPRAPAHLLIVPKEHIATLNDTTPEHQWVLGHMVHTATTLAQTLGIADSGYRLIMNCNDDGGQTVFHIHLHLLGGRA